MRGPTTDGERRTTVPVSEDALDWSRFERRLGNVDAIHVGLKSSIAQGGYPSGYELALAEEAVRRLCAVGRVYSLAFADIAADAGARLQPVEMKRRTDCCRRSACGNVTGRCPRNARQ
jgi:hypothetical protein